MLIILILSHLRGSRHMMVQHVIMAIHNRDNDNHIDDLMTFKQNLDTYSFSPAGEPVYDDKRCTEIMIIILIIIVT